ncbi:MAG: ArsR/SmtB family transcription factor [Alphaproteobacteria bacterium]
MQEPIDTENIESNIEKAVDLLKALSNEKRLLIVCILYKGEKSVGELENLVNLSQSALSQHLARLRRDGLVTTRREAQTIFYSLNTEPPTHKLLELLCEIYPGVPLSE